MQAPRCAGLLRSLRVRFAMNRRTFGEKCQDLRLLFQGKPNVSGWTRNLRASADKYSLPWSLQGK